MTFVKGKGYWLGKRRSQETKDKIRQSLKGKGSFYRHGMSKSDFYHVWEAAKRRCNNPHDPRYKDYGGRGIKCLWNKFEEFYSEMYPSYLIHFKVNGQSNTTLDRIDNSGNYCKENCKWSTRKEQQNNMRSNRKYSIAQICSELGIKRSTLVMRMVRGMSLGQAIKKSFQA